MCSMTSPRARRPQGGILRPPKAGATTTDPASRSSPPPVCGTTYCVTPTWTALTPTASVCQADVCVLVAHTTIKRRMRVFLHVSHK